MSLMRDSLCGVMSSFPLESEYAYVAEESVEEVGFP